MSSHDIVTLSAVASHVASSHKYEVPGDSWGMPITVLCGDCLVRVVGSGLRRCVQSQVRSPR